MHFTIVIHRTVPAFTNEWNNFSGTTWKSMVRGSFCSEQEACERARTMLPHGAPFTIRLVGEDE